MFRFLTATAGAALSAAYASHLRPMHLRWGATDEEVARVWPGDAYCPRTENEATRAVTVNAPASAVWPWILQLGQDRGGFYSYAELENLAGCEMPTVEHIVPEWQQRAVGDIVWLAPKERYGGKACMMVGWLEPERAMVLIMPEDAESVAAGGEARRGVWSFLIDPIDDASCRLLTRSRAGREPFGGEWAQYLFFEPAHFVMERRMLLTIRDLAERLYADSEPALITAG